MFFKTTAAEGLDDKMAISECPACTFHIALEPGLSVGDAIDCPDCGARLKLVKDFPPVFAIVGEG